MTMRCPSCGAELFEGQQFCRLCGATVAGQGGEATTQLLGGAQPRGGEAADTSPVRVGTEPVGGARQSPAYQQPTAYQPPLASFQQTSPLAPPPPRKSRRGLWLVALLAVFMLGAGVAGVGAFVWWRAHRQPMIVVKKGNAEHPAEIPVPPVPPDFEGLGDQIRKAMEAARSVAPLDESGATVSGDSTVLTKTYPLDGDATFSVRVVNGNVSVEGSDGEGAEVKITKHGGSAQERTGARVMVAQTDEGLTFINAGGSSDVEVSYEVRVPRGLRELQIYTSKGDVKVSDFDGSVVANVQKGKAEFSGVTGQVKSNVIKGDTRVVYDKAEREGSQEFSVVKGNIEATLADGTDADVRAETTAGDIDADDAFGLSVEKRAAGRALSGRLGDGGRALRFKVTSGDIKLKK
jgi:Putative adhesin